MNSRQTIIFFTFIVLSLFLIGYSIKFITGKTNDIFGITVILFKFILFIHYKYSMWYRKRLIILQNQNDIQNQIEDENNFLMQLPENNALKIQILENTTNIVFPIDIPFEDKIKRCFDEHKEYFIISLMRCCINFVYNEDMNTNRGIEKKIYDQTFAHALEIISPH